MDKLSEPLVGWRILSHVDEVCPGKHAKARAVNWTSSYATEFVMLEMMAQTAGLVIGSVRDFSGNVVFAKVENAIFDCTAYSVQRTAEGVVRGTSYDVPLVIEAFAKDGVGEQGSWIDARISSANGKEIASAKLFLIDAGDLNGTGKSLTFHPEFLNYYRVREKIVA